ncbi:MAG: TolC family protein [Bacteroidales bacterium]|nr:TolC family protein [Bacteroidales bacterium]
MNLKRTLMLIFAAGVFSGANAQIDSTANQGPLILTLDSAKTYAVQHSKTMRTADLNIQKAEWAKWQAISNMLLNVDGSLTWSTTFEHAMNFMGQDHKDPVTGTKSISASVAINGQMVVGVQIAKMAIEMQQLAQSSSENDVRAAATTSYLSVLIAQESKSVIEDSRKNLEKSYNNVVQLAKVGMAEQTDADQLKVQLMVLDNNLRAADRNIQLAKSALVIALGAPPATEVELTESLDYFFENEQITEPSGNVESNLSMQQLDMNIKLAEKQWTLSRWAYGPTLAMSYSFRGLHYFKNAPFIDMNSPHTLAVSLQVPIFSSGNRYAACKQKKIDVDIAQTQRDQTLEQLQVQEIQLKYNLSNAIETYNSSKESLELYQKIFKNSLQKFNVGTISSNDLITVNNNLLNAQSTYIQSLYSVMNAQTELLKLYNNL